MYKWILVLIIAFFVSFTLVGQNAQYIYNRIADESPTDFVHRYFPEGDYDYSHDILEGYWGDESKGQKIMAVVESPMIEVYDKATLLIFQPVGDGENYILILSNEVGDVGDVDIYQSSVISVFFDDLDDDGVKELFVMEHGELRVQVTLEGEDEDGNIVEHETTACCEDIYETKVFQQKKGFTEEYLPLVENIIYNNEYEYLNLEGAETAGEVKEKIAEFKSK
jgi:hypothetical protein